MPERVRMLSEEEVLIQFKTSREVLENLDELKALLAHGLGSLNGYGEVIAKLADRVLKEEKKKRGIQQTEPISPGANVKASARKLPAESNPGTRTASRAISRQVWQRAKGCCEYVDPKTARRCGSRFALEVDHVRPWARGGETAMENLQLLCSAHHRQKTVSQTPRIFTVPYWEQRDQIFV